MDTGTAYGLRLGAPLNDLAQVGPGTPYGEVLRSYWQPVAKVEDATTRPLRLRVLGEDLILFRTRKGKAGLLHPRCVHRGASLYYGGVEDDGIRCCYHGWVFDTEGQCLEQPCEPDLGLHRDRVRQPWYPVQEQYGLIWAYLGDPAKKPLLPRYDTLEDLAPDEHLIVNDAGVGGGGPALLDFNWLQHWENVMDPFHVPILHARFSGFQFTPEMALLPEVTYEYTDRGVRSIQLRDLGDGRTLRRVTEVMFPNIRVVPSPKLSSGQTNMLGWVVPVDDVNFKIFTLARDTDPEFLDKLRSTHEGRPWRELDEADHQRMPGDYEAQKSQGDISLHSEDHLTTTDQGVAMVRRMMAKQIKLVAQGGTPPGVAFDEADRLVHIEGGNYFEGDALTEELAAAVDD
ncbi:MAG: Rieske 2Fe-2S domain-containing protein [Leifsonia sp.]|uniref:Rieske 2Fe-2S domain-containing protein n=1 Tax=Leifsonia sp. TaxID=1870902 RepID=UPI003F7CDFF1